MIQAFKLLSRRKFNRIFLTTAGLGMAIALNSCGTSQSGAGQYEATAEATYTWRVNYTHDPLEDKRGRYEEFESTSLINVNGEKPEGAVSQDNKGIWWPKLPPKPTIDDLEAGKKSLTKRLASLNCCARLSIESNLIRMGKDSTYLPIMLFIVR